MCGIIGTNFKTDSFYNTISLLKHRGPDNIGFCEYKNNQFGHTRLSIIDLEEEANQPMNFDGLIITFNGEIYNYKELIKKENLQCITKSDTEVLIRLYQKYETDFLNKIEGMFSFCIYDKNKDSFFCARDRFGKKPFYYHFENNKFIYASEIKSILKILPKKPLFNQNAFEEYLTFWTPIKSNTFFKNIFKLEAGHSILLKNNKITKKCYYNIDSIPLIKRTEKKTLQTIEELLFNSIKQRLVSDVDVASLLSGGVDSSLISALYSKISNKKIDTFCIGYDDYKHYSELPYAKKVSTYIKSNHHEIIIGKKDFLSTIDTMLESLDEPNGDSACIPTYLLSKEVSKAGFKVVLSGEGSDEIFLGYDKYFKLLDNNIVYTTINSAFSEDDKKQLFTKYIKKDYSYLACYNDRIKDLSYIDLKIWIAEVLMSKVDKMSMAHSLEVRSPFLDHHLVEFMFSVDSIIKKGDTNKFLLKNIASKFLPKDIVYRRKKGFSFPFNEWLHEEYKDEILNTILQVNKKIQFFNKDFVTFIYNESKESRFKQHIWNLYIFARWFNKNY